MLHNEDMTCLSDATVRRQKGRSCPHCGAYVSQLTDKCPECGQYITPEATKELEEILNKLEEALINMKARKDIERNKAIVERYARKARMYYSNHPKIKILLEEVDSDVQDTEKKINAEKRKKAFMSFITNSKFIWAIILVIGLALVLTNDHMSGWWILGANMVGYSILALLFLWIFF